MRVLVIGSGGREHALCWSIAASPVLTKLWCAPGNPGIAQVAECVPIGVLDFPALIAFAQDNEIDLVVPGPEAPLVAGISRCDGSCLDSLHRAVASGRAARRQQDLHQGTVRRRRHPHRAMGALRRCRGGARIRAPAWRAARGEGGRIGRRQGRRGGRHRSRGVGGDRRDDAGACVRRGRRLPGDRGMPGRRGSLAVRAMRRRDRAAARRRAGPQARGRRAKPDRTPAAWAPIRRRRRSRRRCRRRRWTASSVPRSPR